ncbi:anaerobic ribonucleoside-triphosphate reductase activating protein [Methanocaldococcus sp.]
MKVAGIVDLSTIDYPKKLSSVIFLSGCNFRCSYCHNLKFILNNRYEMSIDEIIKNIDFLFSDSVVISGGEPTLQREVIDLAKELKSLGYSVKLDTNGTNPNIVEEMVDYIDYLALDVKCSFCKYKILTKCKEDEEKIKNSLLKTMRICRENKIFLECRTTYIPKFMDEKDIEEIAKFIDCDLYTIQQYNPSEAYDEEFRKLPMPKREELLNLAKIAGKYVKDVDIRGV